MMPTRLFLTRPEDQVFPETESGSNFGQCRILNQRSPQPAQLTFARILGPVEQQLGYNEIQHGVAEKFQPFIVRAAGASMRQGLPQQSCIFEFVRQGFLQPGGCFVQNISLLPRLGLRLILIILDTIWLSSAECKHTPTSDPV